LARIAIYDPDGNLYDPSLSSPPGTGSVFTALGWSNKALVAAEVLGCAMLLVIFGLGWRRYKGGIPLVANMSMCISAACHPPKEDEDASHKKIMWGAVCHGSEDGEQPGHCCFTSLEVEPLIEGRTYAGSKRRGTEMLN